MLLIVSRQYFYQDVAREVCGRFCHHEMEIVNNMNDLSNVVLVLSCISMEQQCNSGSDKMTLPSDHLGQRGSLKMSNFRSNGHQNVLSVAILHVKIQRY